MNDLFYIPFEVFGLGFVMAMSISVFMKLLMNSIRHFSRHKKVNI